MRTYLLGFAMLSTVAVSVSACTSDTRVSPDDLATATERVYRIGTIDLADTSLEAHDTALDLDGDGHLDNVLGSADAVLHANSPDFDLERAMNARLGGELAWTLTVWDDGDGQVIGAKLGQGLALGDFDNPSQPLRGDAVKIPLGALSDPFAAADPGWTATSALAIRVDHVDDDAARITFGVAIDDGAIAATLLPSLADYFTWELGEGISEFAADVLDTNHDGAIDTAELRASPLVTSLLAPDLEIAGRQAVSLGLGVTAVRLR